MKLYPADTGNSSADAGDTLIYTHAWSARVQILLPLVQAQAVVQKLEWRETHPGWRKSLPAGGTRWDLKGSAWLTSRKPSRSSGLAHRNSEWGTVLYNLSVQRAEDVYYINSGGVRRTDLDRLMNKVLGLTDDQWSVSGWRSYERYLVLSMSDASRLAGALGGKPGHLREENTAKEYLLRNESVPVTIRTRTRMKAEVALYRVNPGRGVTHAWKLEVRLKGRSSAATTFSEKDALRVLDEILIGMVTQHDLTPIQKPARWEPRDNQLAVENALCLPDLKGLRASAYRGSKPVEVKSNTPWPFITVYSSIPVGTYDPDPVIRDYSYSDLPHHQIDSTINDMMILTSNQSLTSSITINQDSNVDWEIKVLRPWYTLTKEIVSLPKGTFSEIILAPFESSGPFIRTLASQPGVKMATSVLTACVENGRRKGFDLVGHEIGEILLDYPVCPDNVTHWVLVVDSDVTLGVCDCLNGRPAAAGVSEHVASACKGWRQLAEETGLNIILVTYDARPVRGKGPWRKSHNFRDTRVRSLIGYAGRYYAHMRYRVESYEIEGYQWAVVLKDGVNGLGPGRLVWTRPGVVIDSRESLYDLDDEDFMNQQSDKSGNSAPQSLDAFIDDILGPEHSPDT